MSARSRRLFVGLISGTSMDGIDAALVELGEQHCTVLAAQTTAYPADLSNALLAASRQPARCGVDELCALDHRVGECFRDAAINLLEASGTSPASVAAIGSHGQTLRHQPRLPRPFTLQLGDPNIIAAGTGIATVADFRRRDLALGGEGAPLTPAFHHWLFGDAARHRVILNIGGFANVTVLPASSEVVSGFDTGPGNSLMDSWCRRCLGRPYDDAGRWAAGGRVSEALLARMLSDRYFDEPPPKSTGFEYFDDAWLDRQLGQAARPDDADVQATLTELTARSIAAAIGRHAPLTDEVVVCGGGVHNGYLLERLQAALAPTTLASTTDHGMDPAWIEAAAFAWLAARRLDGRPGNLPSVTGARDPAILGAIYAGRG